MLGCDGYCPYEIPKKFRCQKCYPSSEQSQVDMVARYDTLNAKGVVFNPQKEIDEINRLSEIEFLREEIKRLKESCPDAKLTIMSLESRLNKVMNMHPKLAKFKLESDLVYHKPLTEIFVVFDLDEPENRELHSPDNPSD